MTHDRGVHELNVPDHPRPGWLPGGVLGVGAGLLLAAIWRYGAWDVALAVTFVFLGLVAAIIGGSSAWRRFGIGLLAGALLVGGVLALLD